MEMMVFHNVLKSFFAPEALKAPEITLLVAANKQQMRVGRWLAKRGPRGDSSPRKMEKRRQAKSSGTRKLQTNLGHFDSRELLCVMARLAILTKTTCYALAGRAGENQNSSTFVWQRTILCCQGHPALFYQMSQTPVNSWQHSKGQLSPFYAWKSKWGANFLKLFLSYSFFKIVTCFAQLCLIPTALTFKNQPSTDFLVDNNSLTLTHSHNHIMSFDTIKLKIPFIAF